MPISYFNSPQWARAVRKAYTTGSEMLPSDDLDRLLAQLESRKEKLGQLIALQSEIARMESSLKCRGDLGMMAEIVSNVVCGEFHIAKDDLISRKRTEDVIIPRHIVFFVLHSDFGASSSLVGNLFGRNHGTVINACRSIMDRAQTDPRFATRFACIREQCRASMFEAQKDSEQSGLARNGKAMV